MAHRPRRKTYMTQGWKLLNGGQRSPRSGSFSPLSEGQTQCYHCFFGIKTVSNCEAILWWNWNLNMEFKDKFNPSVSLTCSKVSVDPSSGRWPSRARHWRPCYFWRRKCVGRGRNEVRGKSWQGGNLLRKMYFTIYDGAQGPRGR